MNFTQAPFRFLLCCCFSKNWSCISTPWICRLIEGSKNSQAQSNYFLSPHWKCPLFDRMLVITQHLLRTLGAAPLGVLTTDWIGTKSENPSTRVTIWWVQPRWTGIHVDFSTGSQLPSNCQLFYPILYPMSLIHNCLRFLCPDFPV